ncbi:MAG: hypothetical protein U5K29_12635 [Acidimicrobiales bacterium]|nr:hypothetical protein [Acidimicrobiales bacterium]
MQITIPSRFQGPPTMGHGGYVAGLFANRTPGAVQITLRQPTPLDQPLELTDLGDDRWALMSGPEVIAESEPRELSLEVPPPPTLDAARAAEAGSPAFYDERGVHPTCFGCGNRREPGDGLRIFVGPTEAAGPRQLAGVWHPGPAFAEADRTVSTQIVLAALDCPGAFAFIADDTRAGLLGRIVFEQYGVVRSDADHIVTGWQEGEDGRKLFAGTALFSAEGVLLAAARATWFQMTVVG